MFSALVNTIHETFAASLLVSVVLALVTQEKDPKLRRAVWAGVVSAAAVSTLLGIGLLATVFALPAVAQVLIEGLLVAVASIILTYVLWWMAKGSRDVSSGVSGQVQVALGAGSAVSLLVLVFLTGFREGAKTALYLAGTTTTNTASSVAVGGSIGLAAGVSCGYAVYHAGTRFLSLRRFFKVTTVLMAVFAAGLVGRATMALQAGGLLPATISVWDTTRVLPNDTPVGAAFSAFVGYTAQPSLSQVIFGLGYLALVLTLDADIGGNRFVAVGHDYTHPLYRLIRNRRVLRWLPMVMAVLFLILLAVALLPLGVGPFNNQGKLRLGPFSSGGDQNNLFEFVLWVLWLPLLSVVTLLAARIWCGNLCPLRLVTDAARSMADRLGLGKGSATTSAMRRGWLLPSAFVVVTFVVKGLRVQQTAAAGALFFIVILGIAALVGFAFRRGTWCRYLCPVGGWLARVTRLSPIALSSDPNICTTCIEKPCIAGTKAAGRCPVALNPSRLETNQHCLSCWNCVINCPPDKASLKVGWRAPSAELLELKAPNLWEALFVAGLLGLYAAVGQKSPTLTQVPLPLRFFGLIAVATLIYLAVCAVAAPLAGISYQQGLRTLGYAFLPLEFGTALIAFGDDTFEFLHIIQPAAAVLLTLGFVWSVVLTTTIVRKQSRTPLRALAAATPLALALVGVLFVWLQWYATGTVVDVS